MFWKRLSGTVDFAQLNSTISHSEFQVHILASLYAGLGSSSGRIKKRCWTGSPCMAKLPTRENPYCPMPFLGRSSWVSAQRACFLCLSSSNVYFDSIGWTMAIALFPVTILSTSHALLALHRDSGSDKLLRIQCLISRYTSFSTWPETPLHCSSISHICWSDMLLVK